MLKWLIPLQFIRLLRVAGHSFFCRSSACRYSGFYLPIRLAYTEAEWFKEDGGC